MNAPIIFIICFAVPFVICMIWLYKQQDRDKKNKIYKGIYYGDMSQDIQEIFER